MLLSTEIPALAHVLSCWRCKQIPDLIAGMHAVCHEFYQFRASVALLIPIVQLFTPVKSGAPHVLGGDDRNTHKDTHKEHSVCTSSNRNQGAA